MTTAFFTIALQEEQRRRQSCIEYITCYYISISVRDEILSINANRFSLLIFLFCLTQSEQPTRYLQESQTHTGRALLLGEIPGRSFGIGATPYYFSR